MDTLSFNTLFSRLVRHGVVHREKIRGYEKSLKILLRQRSVQKVYRRGKVFYELTERVIGALEEHRKMLVSELKKCAKLFPHRRIYRNLLEDIRFVDERNPETERFLFLGDWQLKRTVVPSQLQLAKKRFYQVAT